jgi:hypothetical protein
MIVDPATDWSEEQLLEAHVGPKASFYGLRTHRWAYAEYVTGEKELYDLDVDPYEMQNVAKDPAYAVIVGELSARTQELLSR